MIVKGFILFIFIVNMIRTEPVTKETRRILKGHPAEDTRPYMVYLRPAQPADPEQAGWLCGGVIVHERYVLTSAACIEDVKHFYVVSGTNRFIALSDTSDECIIYGAKKAVWKCVSKNYVFDGEEFDNIRWMSSDIAVVKVEDDFNFERRIRGCEYIPKKIRFNNVSADLEKAGTIGSIAGWGTTDKFGESIAATPEPTRTTANSPELLETDVVILSKKNCKKRWDPRYHHIIDHTMICAMKDSDTDTMTVCLISLQYRRVSKKNVTDDSEARQEQEVNCKELVYSDEEEDDDDEIKDETYYRRFVPDPASLSVHTAKHNDTRRSRKRVVSGGFCENDHGGPLVVGQGKSAVVVGIISACLTRDITKKCYGPFLYTSVWKHRNIISCAIDKEIMASCKKMLRSSKTHYKETSFNWSSHPDGPAKTEVRARSLKLEEVAETVKPKLNLSHLYKTFQ